MRPIYAQCHSRNGSVSNDLRIALTWWQQVLHMDIVEEKFWKYSEAPLAHLFVDVAGKSSWWHFDCEHLVSVSVRDVQVRCRSIY